MLKQESTERQNQIVGRIFSALGMKFPEDDTATEEMLAEWREALADLDMGAITARVEHWKSQGRGCPADEFALNTPERPAIETESNARDVTGPRREAQPCPDPANNGAGQGGAATMTPAEVVEAAKKLYGESDQTFEEAYDHLKLNKRWGPLEGRK